jgi:hypothetical protein
MKKVSAAIIMTPETDVKEGLVLCCTRIFDQHQRGWTSRGGNREHGGFPARKGAPRVRQKDQECDRIEQASPLASWPPSSQIARHPQKQ